ncbi:MAG: nuclear transport factor 2 family protein [Myxococcota bacterium]
MSLIPRFASYAAAFETAYASDDWKPIAPFFADDAVYEIPGLPAPIGGRLVGREAILAYFKTVLDGFDRKFGSRAVSLVGAPREQGASVTIRGRVVYTSPHAPNCEFELEEIATFDDQGRIRRLEDRYDEATVRGLAEYIRAHGKALGLAGA